MRTLLAKAKEAKKLRNFDGDIATKNDQGRIMKQVASVFTKKVEEKKIQKKKDLPSKDEVLEEVIAELGTETDSPSFYFVKEDEKNEQAALENDVENLVISDESN